MLGTRNHSGDLVHYLPCEECGSLVIDEAQLHQWRWDSKVLTSTVSSLICPGQQVVELVADQVWVLGKLTLSAVRPQLVLFRSAKAVQLDQVVQWQLTNKSVIGLFPFSGIPPGWNKASFEVANAIQFDDRGLQASNQWSAFFKDVVSSAKEPTKPDRKRRGDRLYNIELITNHLIEFLIRRKEYAKATFANSGSSEILLCPLQKDISAATELSESVVSVCLHDKRARALQSIWRLCQSIDARVCLKFKPPKRSLSTSQKDSILDCLVD